LKIIFKFLLEIETKFYLSKDKKSSPRLYQQSFCNCGINYIMDVYKKEYYLEDKSYYFNIYKSINDDYFYIETNYSLEDF
ncbi:hypothetical protein, partial [Algoriella sp.]|uniref:hypothetical protein n=1 Tax=Algoriella sp. TaxID=1872434 RepID=UPI001B2018CD